MLLCCLFLCNNKRRSCRAAVHAIRALLLLAPPRPWICLNLHSRRQSARPRPSPPRLFNRGGLAVIELAAYSPFKLQTRP